MESDEDVDMLSVAESVLKNSQKSSENFSRFEGQFQKLFCSSINDSTTLGFFPDRKLLFSAPKFDPKTRDKPIQVVKPVGRKLAAEVNLFIHFFFQFFKLYRFGQLYSKLKQISSII
jgi:hypothetical protein